MLKGLVLSEQVICEVDLAQNRLFMLYATTETVSIVPVLPEEQLLKGKTHMTQLQLLFQCCTSHPLIPWYIK